MIGIWQGRTRHGPPRQSARMPIIPVQQMGSDIFSAHRRTRIFPQSALSYRRALARYAMIASYMGSDKTDPGKTGAKAAPKKPRAKAKPKAKPYQRPRGGSAKSISDLMPEIGRAAFRKFGFVQSSIVTRWPEIAGARYAEISLPESIRFPQGKKSDGTLNLIVSGSHAVLMQHVTPEIMERVNRFFGYNAVSKVKMRQGTVTPPKQADSRTKPPPSLKPIPMELGESLRDIGDPELLAVLEALARGMADGQDDEAAETGIGKVK